MEFLKLISMISFVFQREAEQVAVELPLDNCAFSNTHQDDLWAQLTAQAHQENTLLQVLAKGMDTWMLQIGCDDVTGLRLDEGTTIAATQVLRHDPGVLICILSKISQINII